jgi:SAM-dependent methyltransferase
VKDIFADIYTRWAWGSGESVSGPGSGLERTSAFRTELAALLRRLNAKTLLDAGCGDFNWMKETDRDLEHYIGIDVVPALIAENQRKYASLTRTFLERNIAQDELPKADVILCRDCIVHFSFDDIAATLRNFKQSGSSYLLTTTFIEWPSNADIPTGGWRQLNLEKAPFNFPPPLALVDEKCHHTGGIYADKRFALWPLSDIPA